MSEWFDEEEFDSKLSGKTVWRIVAQAKPYWTWVVGFIVLVALVSLTDSYFSFVRKQIVDDGILGGPPGQGDPTALTRALVLYGLTTLFQACLLYTSPSPRDS